MKPFFSVIILTYNEEIHIERLLKNISDWVDEIFMVDFSFEKIVKRRYFFKRDACAKLNILFNLKALRNAINKYSMGQKWRAIYGPFYFDNFFL